jgi:hypothetical protein
MFFLAPRAPMYFAAMSEIAHHTPRAAVPG